MNNPHERDELIFEAALQLPPEQRAGYLDRACAGDEQLRQRVEALIQAAQPTNDFLENPAVPWTTDRGPGSAQPGATIPLSLDSLPVSEKPGDKIGHYKLLEQIGEGGCGVVYMAEQTEPIRRRVAFKVIKLGMDTKSVVARFEAERQALALMDHPNIAKVLDAGATDTGRPYFVMELVKGIKITDYCDQNHLSTKERLDLFIQVCHAIQHAHQKGIIHRDIKPSNVLVTLHDGVPVPKVIDFGIAKATQQPLTDKTVFTAFGQFIGTPAYMSPEQAELSGLDIDTRTDIYALGVLLYELLTGKPPFEPETLMKAGLDEMRRIIRETEPPKPSTKLATAQAATPHSALRTPQLKEVRGDLDWIVMKCLEKDRTRRYEGASGLALDIERHLKNEPVTAAAPGAVYRARKFLRRHKVALATAGAMIGLLVAGMVAVLWQWHQTEAARRRAEQARQAEARESYAAKLALATAKLEGGEASRAREILESCPAHQRHWEWGHLAQICDSGPRVLEGHIMEVQNLMFTRDGLRLVTYEGFSGPLIWDAGTGRRVAVAARKSKPQLGIPSLAVSADGATVIAAGASAIARWDANNGSLLGALQVKGHVEAMSQDGRRVFVRNPTNAAPGHTVLDSHTGQVLSSLRGSEYASNLLSAVKEPGSWVASRDSFDARLYAVSPDGRWALFQAPNQLVAGRIETREQFQDLINSGLRWHWTIWDTERGQTVVRLPESKAILGFATFSPDGTKLFTQAYLLSDNLNRKQFLSTLWETTTGQQIHQLHKEPRYVGMHYATLRGLFSADGRRLLTREPGADRDNQVMVWDVETGLRLASFTNHTGKITAFAFSSDGKLALTAESQIQVWDIAKGMELTRLTGHGREVKCAVFSPDGRFVASGSEDKTARIWPLQPRRSEVTLAADDIYVSTIGFAAKGSRVYACGNLTSLQGSGFMIWEAATGRQVSRVDSSNQWDRAVLTPDGGSLVTLHRVFGNQVISEAQIWDLGSGQIRHRFQAEAIEVAPDGGLIIGKERTETSQGPGSPIYNLKAWNATNGALLSSQRTAGGTVDLLQDGRHAICWNPKGIYDLMDLAQQRVVGSVKAGFTHGSAVMCFFPEQQRFLFETIEQSQSPDRRRDLRLLNTRTGSEMAAFEVGRVVHGMMYDLVEVASVAPGGGRFIIKHRREGIHRVWLWETDSGKHWELIGHSGDVHGAVFFRDGERVVTVGEDRTMRLWDGLTGRELLSVAHAGPVRRVAVSPDGHSILTVGYPQGMVMWKIPGWGDIVSKNEQHNSSTKGDEHERKIGRAITQP